MIRTTTTFNYNMKQTFRWATFLFISLLLIGCPINEGTRVDDQYDTLLNQAETSIKNRQSFDFNSIPLDSLNSNQKYRFYQLRIKATSSSDVNSIIHDYIELEKYGITPQKQQTINDTWNYLSSLSKKELNLITVLGNEGTLQGWMDLLYTHKKAIEQSKLPATSPEQDPNVETTESMPETDQPSTLTLLENAIDDWVRRYPNHPAANYLPRNIYGKDYILSDELVTSKIALLIPQSGNSKIYGDTILLGIKEAKKFDPFLPNNSVKVYDTNNRDMTELLNEVKNDGSTIIVGPLLKNDVQKVVTNTITIPVLALNKIEQSSNANVCFFALSPEDEASDAATHISKNNHKNPLLILPNNDLGRRVGTAFIKEWKKINPTSVGIAIQYFDSYSSLQAKINTKKPISLSGQLMDASNYSLIPTAFSANPKEIDSIYVYSTTNEFVLIKSLLDMNNQKIPSLFLSSKVNQANLSQDIRFDLENAQLGDIPLLLNLEKYKDKMPNSIKNDYVLARLYAFGVDAASLASRFKSVSNSSININGLTGNISVSSGCNIQQTLSWGTYKNGELILEP